MARHTQLSQVGPSVWAVIRSVTMTHLVSSDLISSEMSALWSIAAPANSLGPAFTAHDLVRRGCDQSQNTQFR